MLTEGDIFCMSLADQMRPSYSVSGLMFVRCWSNSVQTIAAQRMAQCAIDDLLHRGKAVGFSAVSDEPPYGT